VTAQEAPRERTTFAPFDSAVNDCATYIAEYFNTFVEEPGNSE